MAFSGSRCRILQDPVNLGNPDEMTILEFAQAVRAAAGGGGKVLFRSLPADDPKQRQPDIGRARALLGWEPRVGLEEGLRETIAWFRKQDGVGSAGAGVRRMAAP